MEERVVGPDDDGEEEVEEEEVEEEEVKGVEEGHEPPA